MHNAGMKRILKQLALTGLLFLLLLAAGVWALQHWTGTIDFKARAERAAGTALGVAVMLERIEVALWPLPALALEGMQVQTKPVLTLQRLEVRPAWRALLQGRLELATVLVRDALLPQAGLDALLTVLQKKSYPCKLHGGQRPKTPLNWNTSRSEPCSTM